MSTEATEANGVKTDANKLSKPIIKNGIFDNPWPTWKMAGVWDVMRWQFSRDDKSDVPKDTKVLDETLPVHQITDLEIEKFCNEDTTNKTLAVWIGHATTLLNFQNTIILMDPVFSERCAPVQFIGPKRYRPVPIPVNRIPRVDAVIISHNHYDHMDYQSVVDLDKKKVNWFVGKGTGEWFKNQGIDMNRVHELEWWQSKKFRTLEFVFTPAQHWCRRGAFDRNKALWGSWTVIGPSKRFFFAGDTGYCSAFAEIGQMYGPIDLSFIPIGAYEPEWFMQPQHVNPEQAVQIHLDVKSKKSVGIHWGTFVLTDEHYMEPRKRLAEALENLKLAKDSFITVGHGNINDL